MSPALTPSDMAAARILASNDTSSVDSDTILPIRHNPPTHRSGSPIWTRRSLDNPTHPRPRTRTAKFLQTTRNIPRKLVAIWTPLPLPQRIALLLATLLLPTLLTLLLIYHTAIFHFWARAAKSYRQLPGGWAIMWLATFLVSFPPLLGYSTIISLAGMVYGMRAWPIVASATILGSTASFLASRSLLRTYAETLTSKSKKFTALALVLKHDGLKLLIMIRICPLPYSLANGVISTIPTVSWQNFMLATAIASPKLLLHIFVGSRIGDIAENGDAMDPRTKIISWLGALLGGAIGVATGYVTYARTQARAKALEAEEVAAAAAALGVEGEGASPPPAYNDDLEGAGGGAERFVDRDEDDISLHPTHGADEPYADHFTDEEDDAVVRGDDVFDLGDGEEEIEEEEQVQGLGRKDRR